MSHSILGRAQLAKKGLPKLSFPRTLSGQPPAELWPSPRSLGARLPSPPGSTHPEVDCSTISGRTLASEEDGM